MNPWLGLDRLFFSLVRLFLGLWTRANTLPREAGELELNPDAPVVYVLRDGSVADLMMLDRETRTLGLPSPLEPRQVGSARLKRGHFHVYRQPLFASRQRTTHNPPRLEKLVSGLLETPDQDVQLVPVSMFWGRRPDKESSLWKIIFADNWSAPGALKKLFIILTQGRQLYIQISPAMSLRQLVDESSDGERATRKALRILRVHFRRQREAAIGPDLSHRRTLVNSLVKSSRVRERILALSDQEKVSTQKLEARARRYAMEIAADYSHTVIRFLELILEWVWNRLYDGLQVYNIDKLRQVARDHEVVYVPCHRSHADYLLLSYIVYRNGLVPPHIAAGINLNLPVIGTILRRGGAFFLRRSFKDNPLYSAVFDEYMHTMLTRGFSVEYFVEGGRSRSGRMLQPRPGMLAMTVRSYLRNAEKPIALVPVYVGYEKLIEGSSYIGEMHGKQKKKESVGGFLKSLKVLRSHFGEVHVNFGEPLKLSRFLDEQAPQWRETRLDGSQEPPPWFKECVNHLGQEVVTRINAAAIANPVNLLSLALLGTPKHTMDEQQLQRQLQLYVTLLRRAPYSEDAGIARDDPHEIIDYGLRHDFVNRISHPLGNLISTDPVTALQMAYVRNNSLHLFVLPGLISSLMLNARGLPAERIKKLAHLLYPFFRSEYFLPWQPDHELDAAIEQVLEVLLDQGLIIREQEQLVGAPIHSMESDLLAHLGQTVQQALERFYLTVRILVQHGNGNLTSENLEQLASQSAQRLSLLYEFNSPEFFDRVVLRNFIRQLINNGLIEESADGQLTFDGRLESLDDEARRILGADIRQAIQRLTRVNQAA